MELKTALRRRIKAARKRQRHWVRAFDLGRLLFSAEGRARLWTLMIHCGDVHQITPHTAEDRYPDLFDFLAASMPEARRILSFGCSTGEELIALRKRFGSAEIVGAEINFRSRRIAARRVAGDGLAKVVAPDAIEGHFDIVLALAVLQREPQKVAEMGVQDLTPFYPFSRFDAAVQALTERVRSGGLLCVANAHYRVEDSSSAHEFERVTDAPAYAGELFDRDGRRRLDATAGTLFRRF